ncbi:MAG: aspartate aminotransferase family protein [Tunicatimonas sp.]
MNNLPSLQAIDQNYYWPLFNRYPIALVRGEGSRVWDTEGRPYIDLLAGIAVTSVGHCHPKVVRAIQTQAAKLMHVSNLFITEPQMQLTQLLAQRSGLERVFLSNSGAEAVEAAVKLARKYGSRHGKDGTIISMEGCFHGRTLATTAAGKDKYQQGFAPIPAGFVRAPYNDLEGVRSLVTEQTTAILVEPVQWEGGIRVASAEFLRGLRQLCDENNMVLIFDEIQCGMARTGSLFAYEQAGVKPDVVTLAKALGSGVPIGATLAQNRITEALDKGDHGTTFGGNPLACAAALATLEVIEEERLADRARDLGERAIAYMKKKMPEAPSVQGVSGRGLMLGVQLSQPARPVVDRLIEKQVIASAVGGDTIRLVPALIIGWDELQQTIDAMWEVI